MSTFTLAMIVENFFIQNGLRQEELIQKTKAETHNKDGGNYHRNTLLGFRNGLERYLKNPPYNNLDPLLML